MNANDVIESYVRDVVRCLPRQKRNDVAFELRALLAEELAAKAQAASRSPDKSLAMELLKGFGRPAEVAGRYHQRPAVIDPADTHHFLIWSLAGALSIAVLAAMSRDSGWDSGDLLLRWLGALVIVFALIGWWRRRDPQTMRWKPKHGQDWMPRGLSALAFVSTLVFQVFLYAAPQTFVRVMFLGAIPADGVELADTFAQGPHRAATMLVFILLGVLYAVTTVHGGWRPWTNKASIVLYAALGLLLGAHGGLARQGMVFASSKANEVAAPIFGVVGAVALLSAFYGIYKEWVRITPAPATERRLI